MRIPKRYGQSRADNCPFCGKKGIAQNPQKIPVCLAHKNEYLSNMKCACGSWLDVLSGKWGPYFNCMKCGNLSWSKGMSLNPNPTAGKKDDFEKQATNPSQERKRQWKAKPTYNAEKNEKGETVITSDELDFYG